MSRLRDSGPFCQELSLNREIMGCVDMYSPGVLQQNGPNDYYPKPFWPIGCAETAIIKATTRGPRHTNLPKLVALIISLPGHFSSWNLIIGHCGSKNSSIWLSELVKLTSFGKQEVGFCGPITLNLRILYELGHLSVWRHKVVTLMAPLVNLTTPDDPKCFVCTPRSSFLVMWCSMCWNIIGDPGWWP